MSNAKNAVFFTANRRQGQPLQRMSEYFDDFVAGVTEDGQKFSTTADKGDWLVSADAFTSHGKNPGVIDDGPGGIVEMATDDDAGDRVNIQLNGESFQMAPDEPVWLQARIKLDNITPDAVIGLMVATADPHASPGTDGVYFRLDGDAVIDCVVRKDGANGLDVSSGKSIVAGRWVVLGIEWDGRVARFFIDGEKVAERQTDIPTDEALSPILCVESNGAEETMAIDYVSIAGSYRG